MKKAITTKYLPYTNTKPSRIKAFDGDGHSVTIPYDSNEPGASGFCIEDRHRAAAVKLCEKMDWDHTHLVGGGTGKGYVWVWDDDGVRAKTLREIARALKLQDGVKNPHSNVNYAYELARDNAPKGL